MALIVQKYGGSSVATPGKIRRVARNVARSRKRGHQVVVVISAAGDTTDSLLAMARSIALDPEERELDMLLSVGERISMALLSIAINALGIPSICLTGSQCGIITDTRHGMAKILEIRADRIRDAVEQGKVVIVAGFQGVSVEREITTLGRGGSDTTAIALAVSLSADRCDIYTDVDGVFTADPRMVPGAKLIRKVEYGPMVRLASFGTRVLRRDSVEFARKHGIKIRVANSSRNGPGTIVSGDVMSCPDTAIGVVHIDNLANWKITGSLNDFAESLVSAEKTQLLHIDTRNSSAWLAESSGMNKPAGLAGAEKLPGSWNMITVIFSSMRNMGRALLDVSRIAAEHRLQDYQLVSSPDALTIIHQGDQKSLVNTVHSVFLDRP